VTSSYIAQFAGDAGVTLKDDASNAITVVQAILKRTGAGQDGSEVKQLESLFGYVHASPGGKIPSLYDLGSPSVTKRWVCAKGC
jgi:hypothetical protein